VSSSEPPRAGGEPLSLTTNPRLDAALAEGWRQWEDAVAKTPRPVVLTWLRHRTGNEIERSDLADGLRGLLGAEDPEERVLARAELAELVEGIDNPLAEALWEGVLAAGYESEDADTIVDGVSHLASLAEEAGDLLGAAEWHIEFLNWRRQDAHVADPDQVGTAFDEVVRLADADGARTAAAQWTYRQALFTRLLERDPDKAEAGDWERDAVPYRSWA
jgi:hypothetical protein